MYKRKLVRIHINTLRKLNNVIHHVKKYFDHCHCLIFGFSDMQSASIYQVDTNFTVWVLPTSRENCGLAEIGGDDPSLSL